MPEIKDAQKILAGLGMPPAQQNEIAALTLLALCDLKPNDTWQSAQRHSKTISKDIIAFIQREYGRAYAPNTRETFRRQVLHQFIQGSIVVYNPDDPSLPTNSPKAHYAITEAALDVIRAYDTDLWDKAIENFTSTAGGLLLLYQAPRRAAGIALTLPDGITVNLSPGLHNQLQSQVMNNFVPHFASGSTLLYLGDTTDKDLYVAHEQLANLHIPISQHDKLPDIVLYLASHNWLYLIEVVTSHGPITPKRIIELNEILQDCPAGKIFVSAFPSFTEFRKHMKHVAWETEVWIAEAPEHLIHFNGDRFLGPRD